MSNLLKMSKQETLNEAYQIVSDYLESYDGRFEILQVSDFAMDNVWSIRFEGPMGGIWMMKYIKGEYELINTSYGTTCFMKTCSMTIEDVFRSMKFKAKNYPSTKKSDK